MNVLLFLILGILIFGLTFPAFIFIAGLFPFILVAAIVPVMLAVLFFICKFVAAALLLILACVMLILIAGFLPLTLIALPVLALLACIVGGSCLLACKSCG